MANHVCTCGDCAAVPYSDSCQWELDAQQWIARREEARTRIKELEAEVARLREALTNIIYASDGCQGHRECNHPMTPWQEARAILWPDHA